MTNDLISRYELLLEMAAGCVPLNEKGISGVTGDESTIYDYIKNAPAVDAAPVVHTSYGFVGPHIGSLYASHGTCGNCKERILIDPQHKNYCPNCGAKMDKEG